MNEVETLRAEIAELRAEVESLRQQQASHYCVSVSPPAQWPQPTVAPGAGLPPVIVYPATAKPMTYTLPWFHNICAGAAGVPQTLVYNTAAGNY